MSGSIFLALQLGSFVLLVPAAPNQKDKSYLVDIALDFQDPNKNMVDKHSLCQILSCFGMTRRIDLVPQVDRPSGGRDRD